MTDQRDTPDYSLVCSGCGVWHKSGCVIGRTVLRVLEDITRESQRLQVQVDAVRALLPRTDWYEDRQSGLTPEIVTTADLRAALLGAIPGDRPKAGSPGGDRTSDPQPPTPTAEAVGRITDPLPRQSLRDGQETR